MLGLLALAAGGCGGDEDGGGGGGKYTVQDVTGLFERAGGVELVSRPSPSFDSLSLPSSSSAAAGPRDRYGSFNIYVVKREDSLEVFKQDDRKQEIQPQDGIYWDRSSTGGYTATKLYDNVVVEWIAGDERKTDERWARLTTILGNLGKPADQIELPPEETPCEQQNISPSGAGKEGTCKLGERTLTIVNRDGELKLPVTTVSDVELKVGGAIVSRRFGLVKRIRPKEGAFVLVRYTVENTGREPLDSYDPGLIVGDRRYAPDDRTQFEVQPGEDYPFPIQPGSDETLVAPFDVPASVAKRVRRTGAIEVSADEEPSSLDLSSAVGRIRLSAPSTGA